MLPATEKNEKTQAQRIIDKMTQQIASLVLENAILGDSLEESHKEIVTLEAKVQELLKGGNPRPKGVKK